MEGRKETIESEPGIYRHTEVNGDGFKAFALTSLLAQDRFRRARGEDGGVKKRWPVMSGQCSVVFALATHHRPFAFFRDYSIRTSCAMQRRHSADAGE